MFVPLTALYVAPIWLFKYFPSQDGPSHLYNAFILAHYHDPQYVFSRIFDIKTEVFPNWTSHLVLMALMRLVSPLAAEKILLSAYVVLMASSLVYIANAAGLDRTPLAFLMFPFIYSYPLLMGFYNFSIAVALSLVAVGYWWRHRTASGARHVLVMTVLLVAMYFCNPVPLVVAILSIFVMAGVDWLEQRRLTRSLVGVLCVMPSIALLVYFAGHWGMATREGGWTQDRLWPYFIHGGPLIFHGRGQIVSAGIVTAMLGLLLASTLGRRIAIGVREHRFKAEPADVFLVLSLMCLILYFVSPQGLSDGAFLKPRLALFPFLLIVPWLRVDLPPAASRYFGGSCLVLAAACAVQVAFYHRTINREISVYTSGLDVVDRNSVVLPLSFDSSGGSWLIGTLANASGHYGYERGVLSLLNYEADSNHFPTTFKAGLSRPSAVDVFVHGESLTIADYKDTVDYVITWSMPPRSAIEGQIEQYYRQVWTNGKLKIFKKTVS